MIALPITTKGFSLKSYVASGQTGSSGYVGGGIGGRFVVCWKQR